MNEINKYYQSLIQDIVALQASNEEGDTQEQTFTRIAVDMLAEAGETENAAIAYDEKALGMPCNLYYLYLLTNRGLQNFRPRNYQNLIQLGRVTARKFYTDNLCLLPCKTHCNHKSVHSAGTRPCIRH